jgi:hypothetical protein
VTLRLVDLGLGGQDKTNGAEGYFGISGFGDFEILRFWDFAIWDFPEFSDLRILLLIKLLEQNEISKSEISKSAILIYGSPGGSPLVGLLIVYLHANF